MFNEYYDEVDYKQGGTEEKDKFGSIIYKETEKKLVRYVKGSDSFGFNGDKIQGAYKRTYHCPFKVTEGDSIDNHVVTEVRPSRGLDGTIHFWIVRTV